MDRLVYNTWGAIDRYFAHHFHPEEKDAALTYAVKANEEAKLPAIDVPPNQGRMLYVFAKMMNAKHIAEFGTLGAYSTIHLARALPADGTLTTFEVDPRHAEIARKNIENAKLVPKVEVMVGPAVESMKKIDAQGLDYKFDFAFIDADKENNLTYAGWVIKHSRPGTVIVVDNMVRAGRILDAYDPDPFITGSRQYVDFVASHPKLEAFALQTVGSKAYDGFVMAIVKE